MTVGRNEPCPCGSGKKYKKCCMKKQNIVQLQEIKEERFLQQKNSLVIKLHDFINDQLSVSHHFQLEAEFKKRTNQQLSKEQNIFFDFWTYFFHRYDNGLRGIEWFFQEKQNSLPNEEKIMAERWTSLKPQLVQAVDQTETHVIFKDYFTNETYQMPNTKEHFPKFIPWYSTLGLLEPFETNYYFNGVRSLSSPTGLQHAANLVEDLIGQTGLTRDQILVDYYPEILAALLDDTDREDIQEKEIIQYTHTFTTTEMARVEKALYNDKNFAINRWEDSRKELEWIGNIHQYADNALQGNVHIADLYAAIVMEHNLLTFVSYDLAVVNRFIEKVQRATNTFHLLDTQEKPINVPIYAEFQQMTATMDDGVPRYAALYAQNNLMHKLNKPIPKYDNHSLSELVEAGKQDLAEVWLKQSEFSLYKQVLEQHGEVEVTADFNTVRKELGLPMSPFVTGGRDRLSTLEPIQQPEQQRPTVINEADIPIVESLGFTPDTIHAFYAIDIVDFYKEKTAGKSKATERKYRNSLYNIRAVLEQHTLTSWANCDVDFWETLFVQDFFKLNGEVSKTMVKDLITTVKALVKWLAKEKQYPLANEVVELARSFEPRMLQEV